MPNNESAYNFPDRAFCALRKRAVQAALLFAILLVAMSKAASLVYVSLQEPVRYYLPDASSSLGGPVR